MDAKATCQDCKVTAPDYETVWPLSEVTVWAFAIFVHLYERQRQVDAGSFSGLVTYFINRLKEEKWNKKFVQIC